jgi:hypothetical protein
MNDEGSKRPIPLWVWLGGGAALFGLLLLANGEDTPAPQSDPTTTLEGLAKQLGEQTIVVDDCALRWRSTTSSAELVSHTRDFFAPAIEAARAAGASTVDEVAAFVGRLLVPQCDWPPPLLRNFNIEQALAGQLTGITKVQWDVARTSPRADIYLTIRGTVALALATRSR